MTLVEELGLRRVQVLGLLVAERATAEPDHVAIAIADREHQPVPEPVVVSAGVSSRQQAGIDSAVRVDAPRGEELGEGVPTFGRDSDLKRLDNVRRNPRCSTICRPCAAGCRRPQLRGVEGRGELIQLGQLLAMGVTFGRRLGRGLELDAGPSGQLLERFPEVDSLDLLVEREDIAALAASEAFEIAGIGEDDE